MASASWSRHIRFNWQSCKGYNAKHADRKARLELLVRMAHDTARKGRDSRRSTWFCQSSNPMVLSVIMLNVSHGSVVKCNALINMPTYFALSCLTMHLVSVMRKALGNSSTHVFWRAFAATMAQERLPEFARTDAQELRPWAIQHRIYDLCLRSRSHTSGEGH